MRVLFNVHRDRQHLFPLVPLAWACRAAGHEVRIAGPAVLTDVIVHTGLPANWPAHPHLLDDQQCAVIELIGRNSAETAEYMVDALIAFAGDWRPDVMVHDIAGFAGAVSVCNLLRREEPMK